LIYRLDADGNGLGSIRRVVEAGLVTNIPCPDLASYETACEELLNNTLKPGDTVILDTLSMMMTTVLGEFKMGSEAKKMGASIRSRLANDDRGAAYPDAAQAILRWLRFIRNRGFFVITLSHEKEVLDPLTQMKKYGPNHNQNLLDSLNASSSDMFRLRVLLEDEVDAEGRIVRPAYSRVLQLKPTDEAIAKYHVEDEEVLPRELSKPTLPRLWKALRGRSEWLSVYGPPGVGKTTFSVSDVAPQVKEKTNA
jgi:hypothetical protein